MKSAPKVSEEIWRSHFGQLAPLPVCDHGKGVYLYDSEGKKYLDFSGGAMVVNIGHGDERVAKAMQEQVNKLAYHNRFDFFNEPSLELAVRLRTLAPEPLTSVKFANSGSEATEAAIKLAHQYHLEKGNPEKFMVVSRWQSYHGTSLGALSISGHSLRREKFGPMLFGWPKIPAPLCYRCYFGKDYPNCNIECARILENIVRQVGPRYISCFIAEPIGGAASGAMTPVPEYYPIIRDICSKYDMLFIADEVINGLGRTGKWFGIQHWNVNPDMIILAKGLSSGYTPIAVLLISDEISRVFEEKNARFIHGHTLGGNPVSCTIALTVLDIIQRDRLVERSESLGTYLHQKAKDTLLKHSIVGNIRGKGLLLGVELVKDKQTKEPFDPAVGIEALVHQKAMQKGCLIYPGTGTVDGVRGAHFLVAPPFIITKEEIDTALKILDEAMSEVEAALPEVAGVASLSKAQKQRRSQKW